MFWSTLLDPDLPDAPEDKAWEAAEQGKGVYMFHSHLLHIPASSRSLASTCWTLKASIYLSIYSDLRTMLTILIVLSHLICTTTLEIDTIIIPFWEWVVAEADWAQVVSPKVSLWGREKLGLGLRSYPGLPPLLVCSDSVMTHVTGRFFSKRQPFKLRNVTNHIGFCECP